VKCNAILPVEVAVKVQTFSSTPSSPNVEGYIQGILSGRVLARTVGLRTQVLRDLAATLPMAMDEEQQYLCLKIDEENLRPPKPIILPG
jgi:hypothetical protein